MQEFFVLRKFRRRGVGRRVALDLFARYAGPWRVEQLSGNAPAVLFWRRVIADHTRGRCTERVRESPWGPMNVIEFEGGEPRGARP
jgi:predicted acetyltransferase